MEKQIKVDRLTVVFITIMVLVFAVNPAALAQSDYKVGDKIEAQDANSWSKAEIIDAKDGKYKIHYDGYSAVLDVWKIPRDIRRIGGGGGAPTTVNAATAVTDGQTDFKVGAKIEAQDANNWSKAEIIDVKDGKFKIHYDGYSAVMDVWKFPRDIRHIGGGTPTTSKQNGGKQTQEQPHDSRITKIDSKPAPNTDAPSKPKTSTPTPTPTPTGGVSSLTGTAWKLRMYRKSKGLSLDGTTMTMLFCPGGTWDMIREGLVPGNAFAVGQRGTYKVSGKTVTLNNSQDGTSETYTVTWLNARTVELSDGTDLIWHLFEGVKADCK